jgi:LuxR family transcriptional regulator, maltose regulon positive regulatory protein
MSSEPILRIYLFEPMCVQLGSHQPIDETYTRRKAKALFVYLYLNRGRQLSKYQILADLWPENEAAEPGRVKHTVQVLRAALEGPRPDGDWCVIQERGGFYSFNQANQRYSDVEDFDRQVLASRQALAEGDTQTALGHIRRAIELRRGPFLSEFRYDDWASVEIAREQDLYLEVLEQGARLEAAQGNSERAIDLLRSAIAEDPLHESSYAELMRRLWSDGRRTEALRVYHRLRDVLNKRLEIEPQAQTKQLYEAIRRDQALAG